MNLIRSLSSFRIPISKNQRKAAPQRSNARQGRFGNDLAILGNSVLNTKADPDTRTETKYLVGSLNSDFSSVSTTSIPVELTTSIDEGDDFSNRDGRKIFFDSLLLQGTLVGGQSNVVTDDAYNLFRIIVYENAGTAAPPAIGVTAFLTPEITASMGKIFYDGLVMLHTPGLNSTGYIPAVKLVSVTIPIKKYIRYATTTGIGSPNGIYLVMVSDSSAVSHPGFVAGTYVIKFQDC
jgi:hypothetical protein